ncbi:MAG TPA: hypothetical protein VM409_02840 [Chloroflexia bacterium]|nr:hypothetical protein [Chloroflexia bacterium]
MANSIAGQEAGPTRDYRAWVLGLSLASLLMLVTGVWAAGTTGGVPRPWMGVGLLLAIALATVTGVSKTSSA